jgi:hypothetical protein
MSLQGQIDRALAGLHADRKQSKRQKREQLRRGTREEMEHAKTIKRIKRNPKMLVKKAAEAIAKDHLRDDPNYYTKLKAVEKVGRGTGKKSKLKPPRLRLLKRVGRLRVYLVDATAVRKMTNKNPGAPDYTMGTGDQVWKNITGPWEIWISDELLVRPMELKSTMLHEMMERRLMLRGGLSYDDAHDKALAREDYFRQRDWRGLDAALRRERGQ